MRFLLARPQGFCRKMWHSKLTQHEQCTNLFSPELAARAPNRPDALPGPPHFPPLLGASRGIRAARRRCARLPSDARRQQKVARSLLLWHLAGLDWTWTGLCWTGLGWTGLNWTELDWIGLSWTGLDWTGLGWLGWLDLDWIGLDWIGLDRTA